MTRAVPQFLPTARISSSTTFVHLHQHTYVNQILQEFNMETCNPSHIPLNERLKLTKDMGTENTDATQYRSMVGKLIFLTNIRPEIVFAVHCVAKFMQTPQQTIYR
uniref:Reverse transcriptase Ty1/copia-type domain-containing protein n=2 Tax=Physcomitrium patens TaxID=3218 RepID=A0A7I4C0F9_PHYPA